MANCRVAITMTTGHGPLGTQVGRAGALLVICGFLLLFVGRGRSRLASMFGAIPFGVLAAAAGAIVASGPKPAAANAAINRAARSSPLPSTCG